MKCKDTISNNKLLLEVNYRLLNVEKSKPVYKIHESQLHGVDVVRR